MSLQHRLPLLLAILTLAISPLLGAPADGGPPPKEIVAVSASAGVKGGGAVAAGAVLGIEVALDIAAGWHINAHELDDDLMIPTNVTLTAPAGVTVGELVYPAPKLMSFAFAPDEKLKVYEGRVAVTGEAKVESDPGAAEIAGKLRYQACNDKQCLPPKNLTFAVPVGKKEGAEAAAPASGSTGSPAGGPAGGTASLPAPGADAGGGALRTTTGAGSGGLFDLQGNGFVLNLLAVYVMGLLLNLTPCIYPMIPVTIGYFGNQSQGSTRRSFALASFYVLGIAITYSLIGLVAARTGAMFGALLQSPWVLGGIAAVMVALALSSFGLYELQMPNFLRSKATARTGILGATAMGLLMGVVAAPCVGPFVVGLLTYVAALGDPFQGWLLFFVMALGLGTPFLFLGAFSGSIKSLPRSGAWMVGVRRLFGILLLGVALYFVGPLIPDETYAVVWRLAALAAAIYLLGFEPLGNAPGKLGWGFKGAFAAVTALVFWVSGAFGVAPKEGIPFVAFSSERLAAARAEGRPVLVDFTADWCIPCRELEHQTFVDDGVKSRARGFVALRADLTSSTPPEVEQLMKQHAVSGPPTVLFLGCSGEEWRDLRVEGFVEAERFTAFLDTALARCSAQAQRVTP